MFGLKLNKLFKRIMAIFIFALAVLIVGLTCFSVLYTELLINLKPWKRLLVFISLFLCTMITIPILSKIINFQGGLISAFAIEALHFYFPKVFKSYTNFFRLF